VLDAVQTPSCEDAADEKEEDSRITPGSSCTGGTMLMLPMLLLLLL
jgi:hypothetical protein